MQFHKQASEVQPAWPNDPLHELFEWFKAQEIGFKESIDTECKSKKEWVLSELEVYGKKYKFRVDHDISREGSTWPKVSVKAMRDKALADKIREKYNSLHSQKMQVVIEDGMIKNENGV